MLGRDVSPTCHQQYQSDVNTVRLSAGKVMTEILFIVEEAPEGGYVARAVGTSIFTEADDLAQLREAARDAVRCQVEDPDRPSAIRLHLIRGLR